MEVLSEDKVRKLISAEMYPPKIVCYVCGAEVPADYFLYPEDNSGTTPYFPFLLLLEPPLGCRRPSPGGVAKSCRVCYSTLMRQWNEYEEGGVATDRRTYFVKRVEGLPFPSVENQMSLTTQLQTIHEGKEKPELKSLQTKAVVWTPPVGPQKHQQQQQQQQFGYKFSQPSTPLTTSPPSTFSAQYSSYLEQQQQQDHNMGWPQQQAGGQHPDQASSMTMQAAGTDYFRPYYPRTISLEQHYLEAWGHGNYDPHQYQYQSWNPTSTKPSVRGSVGSVVADAAASSSSAVSAYLPKVPKFQDKTLPPESDLVRKLKYNMKHTRDHYSAALNSAMATRTEYPPFTTFDPPMEKPPHASVQDVPPNPVASFAMAAASNLGPAHVPSISGDTSTFKPTSSPGGGGGQGTSEFFKAGMAGNFITGAGFKFGDTLTPLEQQVLHLEEQLDIESKFKQGADDMIAEYSSSHGKDKKLLLEAQSISADCKAKIELLRMKIMKLKQESRDLYSCLTCGKIGLRSLYSKDYRLSDLSLDETIVYNIGGNELLHDTEATKDIILKLYFPKLHQQKVEDFIPGSGMIGVLTLPEINTSTSQDYKVKSQNYKSIKIFEHVVNLLKSVEETDGNGYFVVSNMDEHKKETALGGKVIAINCSKGYVLRIHLIDELPTLRNQYYSTDIFNCLPSNFGKNWEIMDVIALNDFQSCQNCRPYIIDLKRDFTSQLSVIMSKQMPLKVNNSSYLKDFKLLIQEILFVKVKIPKNLSDYFALNKVLLFSKFSSVELKNVKVIAFWTPAQYKFSSEFQSYKKVILDSAPTTGKTLLMMNCISELLKKGKKVLYMMDAYWTKSKFPTLLQMKVQDYFQYEDNFKLISTDLNTMTDFMDQEVEIYDHIFIDELVFDQVNIVEWMKKIEEMNKSLSIVIGFGKEMGYKREEFEKLVHIPPINLAMGSTKQIVDFVQNHPDAVSNFRAFYDDTKSIKDLEIAKNSSIAMDPIEMEANSYQEAFKIAFDGLNAFDIKSAILILDYESFDTCDSGCYDSKSTKLSQFSNYVNGIALEKKRSQPTIYLNNDGIEDAKKWVLGSGKINQDFITDYVLVHGYQHGAIVIFQEQNENYLEHYLCLRSSIILIIVTIPEAEYKSICFEKCQEGITIPEEQERIEKDRKMQFQEKASKYKEGAEKYRQILFKKATE